MLKLIVVVAAGCLCQVVEDVAGEASPKKSSVIYHDSSQPAAGKGDSLVAAENNPRARRQSYSYGGTQRPVSYHEEYNSPPYYYESNNPPQSYHREYHSPPQSYSVDYNERPQSSYHSYQSPPSGRSGSYNSEDGGDSGGPYDGGSNPPYQGGGGGGGGGGYDDPYAGYGDSEGDYESAPPSPGSPGYEGPSPPSPPYEGAPPSGDEGYQDAPSTRFEREIRGDPRLPRNSRSSREEEYTGRINLEY